MAGPVATYLATQQAAQTAFNVPFGLLTVVNNAITAATARGDFNVTVDCSMFVTEDVSNLRIYLDSLGYVVQFAKGTNEKGLNIDWGRFRDVPGTSTTVFQGTSPWIIAGTVDQGAPGATPWPVTITSFPGSITVTQGTTPWTVDGTVNIGNFPAVQPISGTVTALQGTTPWTVDGTVNAVQSGVWTVQQGTPPWSVSVTNFPAVQPISGTVTALQGTSPWVVSGTIVTSPDVNIHDSAGNTLSSTGTSLDVNVTNVVPVSQSGVWSVGRTWALSSGTDSVASVQSGAWTTGRTWTLSNGTDSVTAFQGTSPWVVSGTVVTSPDVNIHSSAGGNLTATGTSLDVNVTNFPATVAVTQSTSPWVVSGTVTANQGTSPWAIAGTVTANIGTTGGLLLDATFTSRINTLGQKTMAASTPVVIASDQSTLTTKNQVASSTTVTRVASSTASHTLAAANAARRGLILYNDSTGVQYVKLGATASSTDFTHRMTSQSLWEVPQPMHTGVVDALSGNNNGAVQVTELT